MFFTHLMFWVGVGHLVGDYLLQTKRMALEKSAKGWEGVGVCFYHCLLYSMAVTVAAGAYLRGFEGYGMPIVLWTVFLTHYPIDRWSLAHKWLKLIRGRQLDEVFREATIDVNHVGKRHVADVATRQSFTALAYAVTDNTLHFLLMTAGFAAMLHFKVLA